MNGRAGNNDIIILGGGLAGLSAGYALTQANKRVALIERDAALGGLSKTIAVGQYRFDLGGHRFFTKNERIERFVKELMGGELLEVSRTSKIYLQDKYFDYPLTPANAMFGLGVPTTLKVLLDYGVERLRRRLKAADLVSLEDWVVGRFGRTMFDIYFRQYSEKVWGIPCSEISAEWVAQRIQGLSLATAVKNAFCKRSGKGIPTLADRFLYPSLGIGRIADTLGEAIGRRGCVLTNTLVERVHHSNFRIDGLTVRRGHDEYFIEGPEFLASIPITALVTMLSPRAPEDVLAAARELRYRDLVVVAVMVGRERVTDQSWIYIPEQEIPLGRIHEPKNWSASMAPADSTLLVVEYFCFRGDDAWCAHDDDLTERTVASLERLGFIGTEEVLGSAVVRVPHAYPLLEVGYRQQYETVRRYVGRFENLHTIGRSGTFQYLNMDHAIEAGLDAAAAVLSAGRLAGAAMAGNEVALVGDAV